MPNRSRQQIRHLISPWDKRWWWGTSLFVALVSGVFYWRTLHPGVGPYLDSIEYQLTTLVLGVSHPPGYPLYTWIGHLFVRLLPFGNPAFRLNLLSAVASVITVILLHRLIAQLTRSLTIATLGALSLAFAVRFWYQATYSELYPIYNTFVAAELLTLILFMQTKKPRYYFLSVAIYAFSFGVNAPAIVLLPMWLWAVLNHGPSDADPPAQLRAHRRDRAAGGGAIPLCAAARAERAAAQILQLLPHIVGRGTCLSHRPTLVGHLLRPADDVLAPALGR